MALPERDFRWERQRIQWAGVEAKTATRLGILLDPRWIQQDPAEPDRAFRGVMSPERFSRNGGELGGYRITVRRTGDRIQQVW